MSDLDCIKLILEEFGKLLAFVHVPLNVQSVNDLEVTYINSNFGESQQQCNKISKYIVLQNFIDVFSEFLHDTSKKTHVTNDVKQNDEYFRYYFSRIDRCICVFGKNVTSEINEIELRKKIIDTRNEFMGRVAHELRTPLHTISATIDNVEHSNAVPPGLRKQFDTLIMSTTTLIALVNDLVDLSAMEAKKFKLHFVDVNIKTVVAQSVAFIEGYVVSKNINLEIHFPDNIPETVFIDPIRYTQVVTNLLSNAVKFSKENGRVIISLKYVDNMLSCSVTDNGIGIPMEKQKSIFETFVKLDNGLKNDGIGLGLSICKNLVSLMDGDITVQSEHGTTTFTFSIPVSNKMIGKKICITDESLLHLSPKLLQNKAIVTFVTDVTQIKQGDYDIIYSTKEIPNVVTTIIQDTPRISSCTQRRCLIVDDYLPNVEVLAEQIKIIDPSIIVDTALSGKECIALVKKTMYNIVFMDISMPEMSGIECTLEILKIRPTMNVIGLTAQSSMDVMNKSISSGMSKVLIKPTRISELKQILFVHS